MSKQSTAPHRMSNQTRVQNQDSDLGLRSQKTGEDFPLGQEMLVGREVECQISLNSGHISRYHAKITRTANGVQVEDLNSTNGTFVNGRRISAPHLLSVGDEIRFHEQAFRLVSNLQGSGNADATVLQSAVESTGRSAPVWPLQPDSVGPADDESATRILSVDELQRLEGKGERIAIKGPDNGSGPRFVVLSAPIRGKVFSLRSQQRSSWLMGRDTHCQFNLFDRTVSGEHARVRRLGEDWVLESCEGRNPIYINNRPVEISTLQHGDTVRVGRMEMIFRTDENLITPHESEAEPRFQGSRFNLILVSAALIALLGLIIGIILA